MTYELPVRTERIIRLLYDVRVNYNSAFALKVVERVLAEYEHHQAPQDPQLLTGYEAELYHLLGGQTTPEKTPLWFELWLELRSARCSGEDARAKMRGLFARLQEIQAQPPPEPSRRERFKQKALELVMLG